MQTSATRRNDSIDWVRRRGAKLETDRRSDRIGEIKSCGVFADAAQTVGQLGHRVRGGLGEHRGKVPNLELASQDRSGRFAQRSVDGIRIRKNERKGKRSTARSATISRDATCYMTVGSDKAGEVA